MGRFYFIPPAMLAALREARHAEYLEQVGLSNFVFEVEWDTRSFPDSDMIQFIQNFDRQQMLTCVRGCSIDLSVESIKELFKLPVCGQLVEQKASMYIPKSFLPTRKRAGSGSYSLNSCQDPIIKERLEFVGAALHIRESRLDFAAYQIKQVEESVGDKNWGEYFCNKFVDALHKAQGQILADRNGPWSCSFASHLQAILNKQFSVSVPVSTGTLPLETTHTRRTIEDSAPVEGNEPKDAPSTLQEATNDEVLENRGEIVPERFEQSMGGELDRYISSTCGPDRLRSSPVESKQTSITCSCMSSCLPLTVIVQKLQRQQRSLLDAFEKMESIVAGLNSERDTISQKHEYLAKEVREKPSQGSGTGVVAGQLGPQAEQSIGPYPPASQTSTVHPPLDVVASYGMTVPPMTVGPVGQGSTNPKGGKSVLESACLKRKFNDLVEDSDDNVRQNARLDVPVSQSDEQLHQPSETDEQEMARIFVDLMQEETTLSSGWEQETNLAFRPTNEGAHMEEGPDSDTSDNTQAKPVARIRQKKITANMPGLEVQRVSTVLDDKKSTRKATRRWTVAEERALLEGHLKYGQRWSLVKNEYAVALKARDQVQIKDKWRNLQIKAKKTGGLKSRSLNILFEKCLPDEE